MRSLTCIVLGLALVGAACDDDNKNKPAVTAADGGATTADGGTAAGSDAGTSISDGGPAGIALVDWVTDLVTHYDPVVASPDTVEDKNIIPTEDPAAFDPLLSTQP